MTTRSAVTGALTRHLSGLPILQDDTLQRFRKEVRFALLSRGTAAPQCGVALSRAGSMPAALWWAITTLTTNGYGDVTPVTPLGRMLGGIVMVSGILVFALWAGILAMGFAEETRRRQFLQTWDLVAKVPFFHDVGAAAIADVARLLQPREYHASAIIVRRGEPGDCMYFVVSGDVEVQLKPEPVFLGPGDFFGEVALLTGGPRNATIVAVRQCTLLSLDIADFRQLLGRQPELARAIHEEAQRRPGGAARARGRKERRGPAPMT